MIFGYLLLAHMLADFVFQPRRLVAWKIRSRVGLAIHALVHFVITVLLFLPFLIHGSYNNLIIAVAATVSIFHFCIDAMKIFYEKKHHAKVYSFIADQFSHLGVIMAISLFARHPLIGIDLGYSNFPDNFFYQLYGSISFVIFLSAVIFSTIGLEVYNFQQQREHNMSLTYKPNYFRILWRLIFVSAIYAFIVGVSIISAIQI